MNKLTDSEIVKGLGCCSQECVGLDCQLFKNKNCTIDLHKNALDLINRQKAELNQYAKEQHDLMIEKDKLFDLAEKQKAELENQSQNFNVLVSDHRCLQQSFDHLKGLYEEEKAKVKCLQNDNDRLLEELREAETRQHRIAEKYQSKLIEAYQKLKTAKSEAVKEFAERLKALYIDNKTYDRPNPHTSLDKLFFNIDNLVKEMVGELDV